MTGWEVFALIMGSGFAAAIISKLGDIWIARKKRKDEEADKKRAAEEKEKEKLEQKQDALSENSKRLAELENIVKNLVNMQKNLTASQLASISERLYYLCKIYLQREKISYEERRRLIALKEAYTAVGGDEDFSDLLLRIMQLELTLDESD